MWAHRGFCWIAGVFVFRSALSLPHLDIVHSLNGVSFIGRNLTTNNSLLAYPVKDPYYITPTDSDEVIKFYDYGRQLIGGQAFSVIVKAEVAAGRQPSGDPVGSEPLQYWADDLQLMLIPREGLKWDDWLTALWGMRVAIVEKQMSFEWSFGISKFQDTDEGKLGFGILHSSAQTVATTSKKRWMA